MVIIVLFETEFPLLTYFTIIQPKQRPKAQAEPGAAESEDNPQPAVQAGRGDSGKERADIAAESDARAVAHGQAADHRRQKGSRWDSQDR